MNEDITKYENIIDIPRHVSKRKPMSLHDRAAQFSPFSALTGLDNEIAETARLTDRKEEISEDRAAELDKKVSILIEHKAERPEVRIEYFVPDTAKEGGAYITVTGSFRRVDEATGDIILADGSVIPADDLYDIQGEIFINTDTEAAPQ